jgi:Predicted hydrolases or acyltransferases (alpha/beta hydrolase superfamily)
MIVHYNKTSIHYQVLGSGPAIVLLHGFLESATMWDRLVTLLSKKNKVITVDLPGHGSSGCFDGIHTMELLAGSVHCVLKEINIDHAILLVIPWEDM